jgi:hypothetical protein
MAQAALAVGSGSTSGTAGHAATLSRPFRGAPRPQASAGRGTVVPTGSGSGATMVVETVVLTALVLLNFVLLAIRDTFRRNNGA